MGLKPTLLLCLCVSLAACGHAKTHAPVYDLKQNGSSKGVALVAPGDSLATLAKRYAFTIEDVIRANGGAGALKPGQRIHLPAPKTYKVKKGDGVVSIARTFDVTPQALMNENNLHSPLYEGQVLKIPQGDSTPVYESAAAIPETHTAMFARPLQGRVISAYGPKPDGLYNDGINIAAPAGSTVHAADGGQVVYAGSGVEGYGNLVLIKHDNGYFTVYSHLAQHLVTKGARVARGQAIGTVGASGKVDTPQLHFEIRKGTKSLDPKAFL